MSFLKAILIFIAVNCFEVLPSISAHSSHGNVGVDEKACYAAQVDASEDLEVALVAPVGGPVERFLAEEKLFLIFI